MKPSEDIKILAAQMAERRNRTSPNPFVLFLGTECGRAAGVPGIEEIARRVLNDLYERDPDRAATCLPGMGPADEDKLVEAFYNLLSNMSSMQRYILLQTFYTLVPVPLFYQDLAVLVKAGHFNHILTTNIDTLLEQALEGAGLRQESDYQVISLGVPTGSEMRPLSISDSPIKIIKLHGDLARQQVNITPDEIEAALESQRHFVKGELKGDIVMVGYEFECEPIEHWLTKSPGGDLWWVSSEYPDLRIAPIASARNVTYILGPSANLEEFFGQLSLRLLRLPVLESMTKTFRDYAYSESYNADNATLASPPFAPGSMSIESLLNDEELESEYLRGQIRRCQEVLYSLEQTAVTGEKNAQLHAQIEYQKRRIAELEDQFRALSTSRPRVVELMEQIAQSVQQASIDPDTTFFLQNQVNTVKQEYSKVQPNQHIVSASIGATVVVSERLGSKIVEPELVSELASFAPSVTATRGI